MSVRSIHHQDGFSLLELTITILLFSILVSTLQLNITRRLSQGLEVDQAELAAGQVYRLANAAQHYEIQHSEWPDELMQCAGAHGILEKAKLLKETSLDSPYLDAKGNANQYTTSCTDTSHFSISINTESANQAARLSEKIPGSTAEKAEVRAHYPRAAAIGDSGEYLPLDGSKSPTDTLDFGNQYVFGVKDIATESGQTLLNSVQYVTTANHDDSINKPTCPGDMEPRIFTALNHVRTQSGRPLHGIQLPIEDEGDTWTVKAVVTGSGGNETVGVKDASITVFVKCSY